MSFSTVTGLGPSIRTSAGLSMMINFSEENRMRPADSATDVSSRLVGSARSAITRPVPQSAVNFPLSELCRKPPYWLRVGKN